MSNYISFSRLLVGVLVVLSFSNVYANAAEEYKPRPIPYLGTDYVTGDVKRDVLAADHIITWQLENGGWNKNASDTFKSRPWDGKEDKSTWKNGAGEQLGTIDNSATNDEILFLAMIYKETGEASYKKSALKGIDFLLNMQAESGGWPQVYPKSGSYSDYVTFNDNAMVRTMNVLRLFAEQQYPFDSDIADAERKEKARAALNKGLEFILQSQIVVDGYPTAWCAQHDPVTYEPAGARSYEHPSISGAESASIVNYLLSLPDPSDEVQKSIVGAIRWFDKVKLDGYKYVAADPLGAYFHYDPNGATWYRFYDIETFDPIFSGRDGLIKHNIQQIERERRDGYRWAGEWAGNLLKKKDELPYFKEISYQLDVDRYEQIKKRQEINHKQEVVANDAGDNQDQQQPDNHSGVRAFLLYAVLAAVSAAVIFWSGLKTGKRRNVT